MKIYVITTGIYSEYHIVAVSLEKETAEKFVENRNTPNMYDYEEYRVEEYDSDTLLHHQKEIDKGLKRYFGVMKEDGSFSHVFLNPYDELEKFHPGHVVRDAHHYIVEVLAKDEEHAKKATIDRFYKWKAEQVGLC